MAVFFEEPGLSPGKIFCFTDVQTHDWRSYLLHLPQPQSKHTLIFKAATEQTKKHIFLFMAVQRQTQAWTNSLLHVPQPQSKDTFIFTAATHKQRMCLHASRSRISQTVFCTVHVQCTHSARYSARHSARPQNAVNTMGLAFCWQFTKNYKNIFFFCVFWLFLGKYVVFTAFCGRALWRALSRALCVHCTCTVQNTMFVPPFIFISRTLQFCFWRRAGTFYISAPCKTHSSDLQFWPTCGAMLQCCFFVCGWQLWRWKCVWIGVLARAKGNLFKLAFAHPETKKTNLVRLCLVGSSFEAASVLGLRFWQMQKGIGSSLYLHIHKPKKSSPGSSKKTAILLHVVTSHLIPPRPLDQCCCPMHAGIRTEMAVFFEGLSKQSDVTTLNWGKGGTQVSSQWVWQDGCFFGRTRYVS